MVATPARTRQIPSIVDRSDFALLRERSARSRSGPLTVRWVPHSEGPAVAFAIGTKFGGAVQRNRLRRRIRAELGKLDRQGAVPCALLLFSAQPTAVNLTAPQLQSHLLRNLQSIEDQLGRSLDSVTTRTVSE